MRLSYEKCIAAVLFAAVCAYLGARLFNVFTHGDSLVLISDTICESVPFEGMALRNEIPLGISAENVVCADGERISAGFELTCGVTSPTSAIYLEKCDGFEYLSLPEGIITAEIVQNLLESKAHTPSKGRLVTGRFWYCAVLSEGKIPEGKCRIRVEPYDEVLTGFVSSGEDGAYIIRIPMGDIKYLSARKISGEMIFNEYTGFIVPDSAVYEKDGKAYVCELTVAGETELEVQVLYSYDGKTVLKSGGKLLKGMSVKRDGSQ